MKYSSVIYLFLYSSTLMTTSTGAASQATSDVAHAEAAKDPAKSVIMQRLQQITSNLAITNLSDTAKHQQ